MLKYASVEKPNGNVHQVYKKRGGGFTLSKKQAVGRKFGIRQRSALRKWAKKRQFKARFTKSQFVFLAPNRGVIMPVGKDGLALTRALNESARDAMRRIQIVSARRTPYSAWSLRMLYLNGRGNLAARCCTRYSGKHSWSSCGRNPVSHHAKGGGRAVDCGFITKDGGYVRARDWKYGYNKMLANGLKATVPSESWHISLVRGPYSVWS